MYINSLKTGKGFWRMVTIYNVHTSAKNNVFIKAFINYEKDKIE